MIVFRMKSDGCLSHDLGRPSDRSPDGEPAAAPRGSEYPSCVQGWDSVATLERVREAFELDLYGGPEAEPQPEPGDFAYPPDDTSWEGDWE